MATPHAVVLPHAAFRELGAGDVLDRIVAHLGLPLMVKPARGGSALGCTAVERAEDLPAAMVACFSYGEAALVERFVAGREVAVTVVDTGDGPRALPAVEVRPLSGVYDYAARYTAELRQLDAPIRDRLARLPPATRVLVTCEGAFSYLARAYDLREGYLWAVNSEQDGSPQQVRRTIDRVRADKVPVVFCESTVSDRAMRQVARETRARFGGVLHVDSLTPADGPAPTYVELLRTNAEVILKGFNVAD